MYEVVYTNLLYSFLNSGRNTVKDLQLVWLYFMHNLNFRICEIGNA